MTMVNTQDVTYHATLFKTKSNPLHAKVSNRLLNWADNQALNDRTTETKTFSKVCDHTICNG